MEVRIVNKSGYSLPAYETQHSAGVDLRAAISERITLAPGQRELIPTGLFIALPDGSEAQIRPRSGLAFKKGITVLNSPGTIDADYRGEVKVLLINLGQEYCDIEPGDRIAQMVFARYERAEFSVTVELDETVRGIGGFGSTGVQ
jgi:dUTP pyrophosphatase